MTVQVQTHSSWLDPLPVVRDNETWTYHRTDTGHQFPISITGVIGAVKLNDAARGLISKTREVWEPRGNTVHHCLEQWLKTRVRPSADDVGEFGEWVWPLVDHPLWARCEVIGSELTVYSMTQNWAGTVDVVVRWESGACGILDLKTKSGASKGKQDVRPQLGAGVLGLVDHYNLTPGRCMALWAYPGELVPQGWDADECLGAWIDCFDLYRALHRPF